MTATNGDVSSSMNTLNLDLYPGLRQTISFWKARRVSNIKPRKRKDRKENVCWSIGNFKFINESFYNMRCLVMFVTAVCLLFFLKKKKSLRQLCGKPLRTGLNFVERTRRSAVPVALIFGIRYLIVLRSFKRKQRQRRHNYLYWLKNKEMKMKMKMRIIICFGDGTRRVTL